MCRVAYNVDGRPWLDKVKNEDFKEEFAEFMEILTAIGKEHGWTLPELKARFSDDLFDKLLFADVGAANGVSGST